jgi:VanZ family protein
MTEYVVKAARLSAWVLAGAIVILSVVPASLRPETHQPHSLEHFGIFFATGVAFGLGYSCQTLSLGIRLIGFAGFVEVVQILIPGRHARLSDFIVDAIALCLGIAIASLVGTRMRHQGGMTDI